MTEMNIAIIPLMLIGLLFALVPLVLLFVLQVYLSKMEKDWPGLVLPILSGSFSLLSTLALLLAAVRGSMIISVILGIILINVPTVIYILIYLNVHKKQRPQNEIDKMTIQDLG